MAIISLWKMSNKYVTTLVTPSLKRWEDLNTFQHIYQTLLRVFYHANTTFQPILSMDYLQIAYVVLVRITESYGFHSLNKGFRDFYKDNIWTQMITSSPLNMFVLSTQMIGKNVDWPILKDLEYRWILNVMVLL